VVLVPREIANADSAYLVSWSVPDGSFVKPGTQLCEIETSKAIVPVEAEHGGYLRQRAAVGEEVPIGGTLGYIVTQADAPLPDVRHMADATPTAPARISSKARRMIEDLGLDVALFSDSGFVREGDVLRVAATLRPEEERHDDPRGQFHLEPLGPIQRRVARVMEQSIATIPVAYLERSVDLGWVRQRAQEVMRASKVLVSPVDLLVAAVAKAVIQFPQFNSFLTPDYQLHLFEQVNVGVAVDVETDLYVVVVKEAAAKSATEIAKELRVLQHLAQRRRLTIDQLSGGTITATSMIGRGIRRFQPILYPEQAAIIGIGDTESGSAHAALTLGFDHRIANGSQAAAFLEAVDKGLIG
jgi:pyruvate/2-oxoglutarate dehydrogenase complex dihydrolipoamide acyltransferase (E2) component